LLPDLSRRALLPELMDDPHCDADRLLRTVRQFALINRLVSRYRTILTDGVLDDMARDPGRAYHLVDVGAGGCDIGCWLLRRAQSRGLQLRMTAIDADSRITEDARRRCRGVEGLTILEGNLFDVIDGMSFDYVFANHLLHHLQDVAIVKLLAAVGGKARRASIFSDLLRSRAAYAGYSLLAGLCWHRSFAWYDGRLSIRKGFLPDELLSLARRSGCLPAAQVTTHFPGRVVLLVHGVERAMASSGRGQA